MLGKTLYFFRHGEVESWSNQDQGIFHPNSTPLGEEGRSRIGLTLSVLRQGGLTGLRTIYTSPSLRAVETAQILEVEFQTPSPILMEGLNALAEFPDELVNRRRHEIRDQLDQYEMSFPLEARTEQLRNALELILKTTDEGESVGVVTHGNTLRLILFLLERGGRIPSFRELKKMYPVNRSECIKVIISSEGKILEKERIGPEGAFGSNESGRRGKELL